MSTKAQEIIGVVCAHYGLTVEALMGRDRHKSIAEARKIAIWLCRRRLRMSYPELGRFFGGRDHTTCISAFAYVERATGELFDLSRGIDFGMQVARSCGPWAQTTGAREVEFAAAE